MNHFLSIEETQPSSHFENCPSGVGKSSDHESQDGITLYCLSGGSYIAKARKVVTAFEGKTEPNAINTVDSLYSQATLGTNQSVLIRGVASFQGITVLNKAYIGGIIYCEHTCVCG